MFCEKCGTQLPDDAKFCEKCGSSTEPGSAPAPAAATVAAASAPAAPSAFSIALKKFFSNKRNVIITLVALFLIIAAIVTVVVVASQPKMIYIDDYFHVEFEGVDGSGRAYLDTNDKENKEAVNLNKKLFGDDADKKSIGMYITPYIDMTDEELNSLKNGQTIKIKLKINKEIYDEVDGNYKFALRHKTVKVKGLYKSTILNILDHITPAFKGYNGYGVPNTSESQTIPLVNGAEARVEFQSSGARIIICDEKNDYEIITVYANFNRSDNLSNGESVSLSINAENYNTSDLFNGYGIVLSTQTRAYTVSGLEEPINFNVTDHIKPIFKGISTVGIMNFQIVEDTVTVGDYTVKIKNPNSSSEYSDEFSIELRKTNGESIRTITYYANGCDDLKNGDKITFDTYADIENILADYGISFPKTFEVEVTGLDEPFNADPVGRGTYSFTGYNGFGAFIYDLPDDKCVYTTDDGQYTIKLSFTNEGIYYYKITVVVADANGRNFLSFYYDAYAGDRLMNESVVEFTCSEWTSTLKEYVKDYGIYFPHSVRYKIDKFENTTIVQPLENLTFSFAKDGDYVRMSLGLTENVITVGESTINLSLEKYNSWGAEYTKLNMVVKDKNGNTVGTGYYELQTSQLYEGNTIWANHNIPDYNDIARATGIELSTESFTVIVSSK